MANPLITRNSNTAGSIPTLNNLQLGELGLNTYDGILFARRKVGNNESIVNIGGPDFGSKDLVTTGALTSGNLAVTSTTLPAYGLYKFDANTLALSANSSPKLYINKDGNLGVNVTPVSNVILRLAKPGTSTAYNLSLHSGGPADPGVQPPGLTFEAIGYETPGTTVISTKGGYNNRYLSIATGTDTAGLDRVYVTHDGYIRLTTNAAGIQFEGVTAADQSLNDYERGWYNDASSFRLLHPSNGTSFGMFHPAIWNSQGNYIKVGNLTSVRQRVQGILNDNITNLSSTTYDSYVVAYTLPYALAVTGTDYGPGRVVPVGTIFLPQAQLRHNMMYAGISTNFAYDAEYPTWGALRAALTPAPNYQLFLQLHYIAA